MPPAAPTRQTCTLLDERVGADLELDHPRFRSLPTFEMPRGVDHIARPQSATFPPRVRVVDPSVHRAWNSIG